jgi:hypothetical protein
VDGPETIESVNATLRRIENEPQSRRSAVVKPPSFRALLFGPLDPLPYRSISQVEIPGQPARSTGRRGVSGSGVEPQRQSGPLAHPCDRGLPGPAHNAYPLK